MPISTITVSELSSLQASDPSIRILDVRSPAEYESIRATTADNVPLDRLDAAAYVKDRGENGKPIYVICKMGGRSLKACEKFVSAGFDNVVNVTGGTDAWAAAGYPVHEGERKVMSIDRQVRVMAGSIVAMGAALSYFHPAWVLLSAFIGCGLVYSGLTDTCGMANVLAMMPWNQSPKPKPQPAATLDLAAEQCDTGG